MKIAVFGENINDTRAIRELLPGLRPADVHPRDIKTFRKPPTLTRHARGDKVRSWAEKAARVLKAATAASGRFDCVLAHTDADGPDDGSFARKRTEELRAAGLRNAVAVVPVQAIESWWLLFPEATESIVAGWRGALDRSGFNTDEVNKPKDVLVRLTSRRSAPRPYQEADSPAIARAICAGHLSVPRKSTSPSFDRFTSSLRSC